MESLYSVDDVVEVEVGWREILYSVDDLRGGGGGGGGGGGEGKACSVDDITALKKNQKKSREDAELPPSIS